MCSFSVIFLNIIYLFPFYSTANHVIFLLNSVTLYDIWNSHCRDVDIAFLHLQNNTDKPEVYIRDSWKHFPSRVCVTCEVVLDTIDPLSSVHFILCLCISLSLCCGVSGRSLPWVASPVSSLCYATSHVYIPVPTDTLPQLDTCTSSARITSQCIFINIFAECILCYCWEIRRMLDIYYEYLLPESLIIW